MSFYGVSFQRPQKFYSDNKTIIERERQTVILIASLPL